jgi:hypothetical protein
VSALPPGDSDGRGFFSLWDEDAATKMGRGDSPFDVLTIDGFVRRESASIGRRRRTKDIKDCVRLIIDCVRACSAFEDVRVAVVTVCLKTEK